ncbi:trypsin/chymotrypsin inhibitor, partial [Trifolium medium]|nr:trypsin/chymotrypsin inhibitor [Trifolium medium]
MNHAEQQQQTLQWQRPAQGWYKCNVDAGFHHESEKTTAGEALALFEAMKEVEQRGLSNVIFETDSTSVREAIHGVHTGVSEFSIIINKIRCMLSLHPDFEVKSIRRQANMVAHTFAKAAVSWSSRYL